MAVPIFTPRINNNDDFVNLVALFVKKGDVVGAGQMLAEIETDKANFSIESEHGGYVLDIAHELHQSIAVGSVLMWIGDSPEEVPPGTPSGPEPASKPRGEPTLKALLLLTRYGLSAADVKVSGDRLSAADVLDHVQRRGISTPPAPPHSGEAVMPEASGKWEALSAIDRGMIRTVGWHRDHAVPGYVEIQLDSEAWDQYAQGFQQRHRLLMSPLLGLMAHRLSVLARTIPKINSTVSATQRFVYDAVNLGFTVQTSQGLFLAVVSNAGELDELEFVNRLGALQRGAMKNKLRPEETQGATISFSSMARWNVSRHIPVLAPHTSLMVAHAAGESRAALGATYDHRVLTGADAVEILHMLASPGKDDNPGDQ